MLLSAVSVLVVAQSSSEVPEGLMNNPVYYYYNHWLSFHNRPETDRNVTKLLSNDTMGILLLPFKETVHFLLDRLRGPR